MITIQIVVDKGKNSLNFKDGQKRILLQRYFESFWEGAHLVREIKISNYFVERSENDPMISKS